MRAEGSYLLAGPRHHIPVLGVSRQNIWHHSRRKLAKRRPCLGLMLGGKLAVLQAPMCDGLAFDPFSLLDDGWSSAEVRVCGRHVAQALMVALVIVMLNEGLDLRLLIFAEM